MNEELVEIPESMPSEMVTDEPATARFFGTLGIGTVAIGSIALWMNNYGPRLVGPTMTSVLILFGVVCMLFHAARDSDLLIRRLYLALGFACLGAGMGLSAVPRGGMVGEWFLPWGALGLLGGLLLLLSAGRHETQSPWDGLTTGLLGLAGIAATVGGLIGVGYAMDYVPRFTGIAFLGLILWWAAISRFGATDQRGYRFGQLLGVVGLAALLFGIGRSALPPLLYSWGASSQVPGRYFVPQGLMLSTLGLVAFLLSYATVSDRPLVAMTRRELMSYFYSPVAYLVLMGSAIVAWITYAQFVGDLLRGAGRPMPEPIVAQYIVSLLPVFAFMFMVPVITMRLFAEERRTGTLEVLLTTPVSEFSVMMSKFVAAWIYFLILSLPWGLFLIPVYQESRQGFDYLPLLSFFVALLASGAAFVSMGVFFSSLTRNQIVAAALTFAGMVAYLAFYFVGRSATGPLKAIIDELSFIDVWIGSLSGKLYVHNVLTYFSITAFWLFLTVKVLESRKWS